MGNHSQVTGLHVCCNFSVLLHHGMIVIAWFCILPSTFSRVSLMYLMQVLHLFDFDGIVLATGCVIVFCYVLFLFVCLFFYFFGMDM